MTRPTPEERRASIIAAGQDPDLPRRGVADGTPPPGLRNWVCAADGHEDPDNSGLCIHCGAILEPIDEKDDDEPA